MAVVFAVARALEPRYPGAGLCQGLRRSGDGRRARRLVRGHRAVPPSARPADPAHGDHPAQQGPDRRGARQLPPGEFPRFPSVVARRMRNIDVAGAAGRFLQTPAGEGTRIRAGASRLIADIFESLDDERLGGIVKGAIAARLRKTEISPLARPCARLGDQRGPPRADARGRDPLDRARARRQRAADPRDGAQESQLGAEARRARRQARRRDHRRPAQAHRRDVDRSRAPGPDQGRGSARAARQRPPDAPRNARAGRGDQGAAARQQIGQPVARHALAEGPRSDHQAPRATPTRCSPASSAKC